jgi:hypothetical protein
MLEGKFATPLAAKEGREERSVGDSGRDATYATQDAGRTTAVCGSWPGLPDRAGA